MTDSKNGPLSPQRANMAQPKPAAAVQGPPRRTGGVPLGGEDAQRLRGGFLSAPLYRLAHSRTGDKGNRSNISVIAWHPALWDVLVEQVTEAAVARGVFGAPTCFVAGQMHFGQDRIDWVEAAAAAA